MNQYYLHSNTVAEPLINKWYVWPMLISPATAALYTVNMHLKIMQSYIRMPKMHAAAVKDQKMRGGPFMDFNGVEKVEEVKKILSDFETNNPKIVKFGQALMQLNKLILEKGDGNSLAPLYKELPDELRGYVELVYDANHRPSYRILEALLYQSDYYNVTVQELLLFNINSDYRPFVLSTPRLQNENDLALKIPFKSFEIDNFFSLRERGKTKKEIVSFFNKNFEASELNFRLFNDLFCEKNKQKNDKSKALLDSKIRVRYFGHACVLIETDKISILIDPIISYHYNTTIPRYTFEDLPETIDYVLLTHSHQDHILFEHLLQLRYKIKNIVVPKNVVGAIQDPSLKLMFQQLKFNNVIELDELESINLSDGEIIGVPFYGEHGDLNIHSKIAYLVNLNNHKVLFAADSNNIEPVMYAHLQKIIPKIDVMFIGMECDGAPMSWLYEPILGKPINRAMDQSRRLDGSDSEKALDLIRKFDCKKIYIYAMGQEPWLGYITSIEYESNSRPILESNKLIEILKNKDGNIAERLYAMKEIILE